MIYTGWLEAGSPSLDPNVLEEPEAGKGVTLLPPYPNPAVDQTTFKVKVLLPQGAFSIKIYDALGRMVTNVADTTIPAGTYLYSWCPESRGTGVFYCVLEAGGSYQVRKLVILE